MSEEIVLQGQIIQPVQQSATMQILAMAKDPTVDIARIKELMVLAKEWDAEDARKQYHAAKAAFKAESITVVKDAENTQFSKPGKKSMYVSLGNLVQTVNPFLGKHGLGAAWDVKQNDGDITVICTLTHAAGHSESVELGGKPDTSGAKNAIQQIKSTITYLKAVTFESVCGLAATEEANADDDGNAASNGELITTCKEIESADTFEEAKKIYDTAYAAAKAAKNSGAQQALIAAKETWKKKNAAAQPKAEKTEAAASPAQLPLTPASVIPPIHPSNRFQGGK